MILAPTSDQLPRPRFRYSPVIQAGPWFVFSGMIALDRATGLLVQGGPGAETEKILANLSAAMPDFGLQTADLAGARIYTTQFECFAAINAAWDAWLGPVRPPARTSVGVAALPLAATVEIEFSFYKDSAP